STSDGPKEVERRFGANVYDYPKPTSLMSWCITLATQPNDEYNILDSFAVSSSTAHYVLELYNQDKRDRRFILLQLPEPTDNPEYPTISEITKERVRRVINQIKQDDGLGINQQDLGFKVFKLDSSNFKIWDGKVENLEKQLEMFTDNIKEDRSEEDLLYEIVLKAGYMLTEKIETVMIGETKVYSVKSG